MTRKDAEGASLLSLVVATGSKNAFQTVLEALDGGLNKNEVRHFKLRICLFPVRSFTHCNMCRAKAYHVR